MSRAAKAILVVMLVVGAIPVYSLCRPTGGWCGWQCGEWGGGLYCIEPSNPDRACWHSGTGNVCGEDSSGCTCSGPGQGGF